ncbi:oligosaccharide flippase family protein [Actinoplanes sp. NPDC049548]|uniref:oligosaccharide flippase family protein n=1 Tax=Actinoplanes sp. NPDC049548 TaxID=3155152 RepID=UPI00342D6098
MSSDLPGTVVMADVSETAGKLAGSAVLLIGRKVAGSVLSAVSSIVVVRSLLPGEFGEYAAGLAAFYMLLALTEFGFSEVFGRALGQKKVDAAALGRLVLKANLVWSSIVAAAAVVIAGFFAYDSTRGGTLLVMAPAVALAGTTAMRQFFYAKHEVGRMATVDLSTAIISTIAIVGSASLGAPAVLLAAFASAAAVVNSLVMLRVASQWMSPRDAADGDAAGVQSPVHLIKEAFPIGFASFLSTAYVSIDVVILSNIFPAEVVGQYASAVKLFSILTIFPGLVMSIALPQLAAEWDEPDRMGVLLSRLWHWFMSLVMPGLVIVAANARGVMTLLFGDTYGEVGPILRILAVAGAVSMLTQLLGVVVVAAARARWLVGQNIIALAFNVGGNLLFAPRFGISASAWLTVATEVIVCGGSWLILRDRIPCAALSRVSLLPTAAVAVAVAIGWIFVATPWMALTVSAVAYVLALSALRGWPVEMVRMIPSIARPR